MSGAAAGRDLDCGICWNGYQAIHLDPKINEEHNLERHQCFDLP